MPASPTTSWVGAFGSAWRIEADPPRRPIAIAISTATLVLVLGVLAGLVADGAGSRPWTLGLDVAIGLGGAVSMPAALRRPMVATIGFAVLSVVSPTATPLVGTALLWLSQHAELRVAVPVAAAGVLGQALRQLWRPEAEPLGWWLAAVVAGFAAVVGWGAWSSARRQLLASLLERARRAEEEQAARVADARRAERERIAREMHDVLAHRLSLLATYAGAVEYNRGAEPDRLVEAAQVIRAGAHDALTDLRQVIDVLRTDDGERGGDESPARPQPTLADLPHLVEESRRAGAPVALRLPTGGATPDVPPAIGRTAYRLVQEALTNARKHAPDQPVRVAVYGRPGADLVVDVRNPVGGDPLDRPPGSGTGLVGMAERVRLVGGELEAGRTGSGEFRIHARLPWPA